MNLQELVTGYLSVAGGAVAVRSYALVEALVPPGVLDPGDGKAPGEPAHLLLAFDAEVAQENEGAEFITYGHPLLDRILQACLHLGTVRLRCAQGVRLAPPQNLAERVARELTFVRARSVAVAGVAPIEQHALAFDFHVLLEADEQEAREVTVLVDLHTGLPLDHLLFALGSVLWGSEPDLALPTRPLISPWEAYASARAHLEAAVLPPLLEEYSRRLRPHLDRELRRVEEYFAALLRDLERRQAGAQDPERAARLAAKLAATRADRDRRLEDLRQKYAPRARPQLLAVTWYRWPRLEVTLTVDRRTRQDTLQVAYDPLARQVQPLPCARCRRWIRTLDLDEGARPVCPGGCSS